MKKSGYTLTRLDISPSNGLDLDERFALEHFFGKNQEDAAALLEQNFEYYVEDLPYMGDKAFSYYLGSVKLYLEKNEEKFFPSDYVSIAQNLLNVFRYKKALIFSGKQEVSEYYLWIDSFVINSLNKIIQDDNSWIIDHMLTSEKKIENLIKRWNELKLGYST